MKTIKRLAKMATAAVCAVLATVMLASLVGCGGGAATLTGTYASSANQYNWSNMQPMYNFYTLQISTEKIETFSDGTYCFTLYTSTTSNLTAGADVKAQNPMSPALGEAQKDFKDFTANPRGYIQYEYYGTFEEVTDSFGKTLKLAKPTRVVYTMINADGEYYVDTANWTDVMGTKTGTAAEGSEEVTPGTAEDFLTAATANYGAGTSDIIITMKDGTNMGTFEFFKWN